MGFRVPFDLHLLRRRRRRRCPAHACAGGVSEWRAVERAEQERERGNEKGKAGDRAESERAREGERERGRERE